MGMAFGAVVAGALLRVGAGFAPVSLYVSLITVAGLLWTTAFVVYLSEYARVLCAPRTDGRPG
jgi:uncharacterized protein involved in response to NO